MSADNETLLEIIDSVAMDLTGAVAQTSNVSPNKASLIEKVNDKQKDICNSREWTFLMESVSVDGYSTSSTVATLTAGLAGGQPADCKNDETAGKTSYWAEKITTVSGYLSIPKQINVWLAGTATGAGAVSGSTQFFICPDLAGNPDIDNPVSTFDVTGSTIAVSTAQFLEFPFGAITTAGVLLKGTQYWIVMKFIGAADNGDGLAVEYGNPAYPSTTTKTRLNNATTWTAFTTGRLRMSLDYYQGSYISTLTLPANAQKVFRLYSGTSDTPTDNLLPYSTTNFMHSPELIPKGYFIVKSADNGLLDIWINPVDANVTTWVLDYKKSCSALSADADYPLLPRNYRALLKKGVLLYYVMMGLGMQDQGAIALLQAEYDKMLRDMRAEYLPNPAIRIGVSRRGGASTGSPFNNYSPNTWSVK
jgi:hypothetical protein